MKPTLKFMVMLILIQLNSLTPLFAQNSGSQNFEDLQTANYEARQRIQNEREIQRAEALGAQVDRMLQELKGSIFAIASRHGAMNFSSEGNNMFIRYTNGSICSLQVYVTDHTFDLQNDILYASLLGIMGPPIIRCEDSTNYTSYVNNQATERFFGLESVQELVNTVSFAEYPVSCQPQYHGPNDRSVGQYQLAYRVTYGEYISFTSVFITCPVSY